MMRRNIFESGAATQAEHQLQLVSQPVGAWAIRLVDDEDVGDLHEPCLQRLYRVTRFWYEHDDARVRGARDVQLTLANADRLDEYLLDSKGVEHVGDLTRRGRQTAERSPRRHRPNEDAGIESNGFHTDPIAEQRTAGKGRCRVDGDDADGMSRRAVRGDERRRQCALPRTGRASNADSSRAAESRVKGCEQAFESLTMILDDAHRAGERRLPSPIELGEQVVMHRRRCRGGHADPRFARIVSGSSCSSRMSPTSSSSRSSSETRPIVDPLPSRTMARCRRSRSMRKSSSLHGDSGVANATGRNGGKVSAPAFKTSNACTIPRTSSSEP